MAGHNKQDVKQALLDVGWNEQDTNEAFDFYFTSSHPVQQPSTQPSFAPNQPEPTTIRSKTSVLFIVLLIILGIAAIGYFVSAKYLNIWPFEVLSPQPILTTTPRPDSYFQIKEWGIEFKLPSDLKDLIYVLDAYGSFPGRSSFASFSTKSLMDLDKQTAGNSKTYCDPKNNPVGGIVWYSTPERGQTNKVIDGHYYYYTTPQATCSDNKQVQVLEGKIVNDLVASFQSLRKIGDFNNQIFGWKTYRNEKYGFEFMYPVTWKMVKELQASSIDYLPVSRNFVAIYPTSYPTQDFSARIDVYNTSLATVRRDNPFIQNMAFVSTTINGISWIKMGATDYLIERNGKTYHVSGQTDLSTQIVSTFKFTQ